MSKDDLKWGRSYIKEEEEERIHQTAINLAKRDGLEEGKALGLTEGKALGLTEGKELGIEQKEREIIISLYEEGFDIASISKIVKVDTSKVEQILETSTKKKAKILI